MAIAALQHPTPVLLLTDALDLVQAAARLGPVPADVVTAAHLHALVREVISSARELEVALTRTLPAPEPVAVLAGPEPDARTGRPGSLRMASSGDEVHLRGRGPAAEGDLVRAALHQRAGAPGSDAQGHLGELLWAALVALSRDGSEPPTALPTPLTVLGRHG